MLILVTLKYRYENKIKKVCAAYYIYGGIS